MAEVLDAVPDTEMLDESNAENPTITSAVIGPALTVMTYNVKNNSEVVTGWMWPQRRPRIIQSINSAEPVILGIQEGEARSGAHPAVDLHADLAGYAVTPPASNSVPSDATSIYWKTNRFLKIMSSIGRFSNNGATPCKANDYWNIVELHDQLTNRRVRVINVHLIPGGLSPARAIELNCTVSNSSAANRHAENNKRAKVIANYVSARNAVASMPSIILGDLNARSEQCNGDKKAPDVFHNQGFSSIVPLGNCAASTTWNNWATAAVKSGKTIDYIFRSSDTRLVSLGFGRVSFKFGGKAPSDHLAVYANYQFAQ